MKINTLLRLFFPVVSLSCALLAGCAHYRDLPGGTVKEIASPVVERQAVQVDQVEPEAPPSANYVIGRNDILFVSINGKPEFTTGGTSIASKVQGSRVDGNGTIHLPVVGSINVEGLTISETQSRIEEAARKYLMEPWAVVEIAEYKSRPLYLLGQFKAPGTYYMDRSLNLMQGLSLGNGFDPNADLRGARLTRAGKIVPVDIEDLLTRGDVRQNIWLKAGDSIYLPDGRNQQVFIFGAVKKPGAMPIPPGGLNLAQAIGSADLRDAVYDIRYVRIIRSLSTTRGELFVVDLDKVMRGQAMPFQLMAGDVIYVPKNAFGTWNDAIAEILPSLQAVSALLQPFVNIKFLTR